MGTVNRRAELLRSLKFTLFSASAGLIQIGAFALCNDVIHLPHGWAISSRWCYPCSGTSR